MQLEEVQDIAGFSGNREGEEEERGPKDVPHHRNHYNLHNNYHDLTARPDV